MLLRCRKSCGVCTPTDIIEQRRRQRSMIAGSKIIDAGTSLSVIDKILSSNRHRLVVAFYAAGWCGNSRRVARHLRQVADRMAGEDVVFVYVDCWSQGECKNKGEYMFFPQVLYVGFFFFVKYFSVLLAHSHIHIYFIYFTIYFKK